MKKKTIWGTMGMDVGTGLTAITFTFLKFHAELWFRFCSDLMGEGTGISTEASSSSREVSADVTRIPMEVLATGIFCIKNQHIQQIDRSNHLAPRGQSPLKRAQSRQSSVLTIGGLKSPKLCFGIGRLYGSNWARPSR